MGKHTMKSPINNYEIYVRTNAFGCTAVVELFIYCNHYLAPTYNYHSTLTTML